MLKSPCACEAERGDDLERRAGWVEALRRAVDERMVGRLLQLRERRLRPCGIGNDAGVV
jgi:hypothetical protein